MWDLGQVIGVLLDPPSQGRALLREESDGQIVSYQAAWRTERALEPGRWYLRRQAPAGHATETSDGVTNRSFEGLKLIEQATGRPDYWPPTLHLLLPLKAWFWGRPGDDWRMLPDVRTERELATVNLSHTENRDERALLVVDMERRLLVRYERPSSALTLVAINTALLWDGRGDSVGRRVSDEQWVPAEPQAPSGTVRYAG